MLSYAITGWLVLSGAMSITSTSVIQGTVDTWVSGSVSVLLLAVLIVNGIRLTQTEFGSAQVRAESIFAELKGERNTLEERVIERTSAADAARAIAETSRMAAESARSSLESQIWLATGQTQIADAMRGEQDVDQLAENVISQLCQYTGAHAGALFLLNEKILNLAGRYAFTERSGFNGKLQLGEGFVGQAAADEKILYLEDIPSNTFVISTGLVEMKPRQIAAAPFRANGKVMGVLELATLSGFTKNHLELWERVSESIGVAFRTAQTRQRLAELLMESQQQAEELQAQEEELRAANEELHAQAENLKFAREFKK
jgi:hypothetical protein